MTQREFIEECVIVGGGVAGLSAANQLADAGLEPLLIEASDFPAHRICGEFLSSECLPILQRWEIPWSATVKECSLFSGQIRHSFELPTTAGSCSRFAFDWMLQKRALAKGARMLTQTMVTALDMPQKPSDAYTLTLSNGQTLKAKQLILGTGRIPKMDAGQINLPLRYVGFKAHFEGLYVPHKLEMHCLNGGYFGISPVDELTTNIACIVKKEHVPDLNPHTFITNQWTENRLHERLANAKMLFPNWLVGHVPEFGIRNTPSLDRVFWIGDAAGSIPPISGDGLAIGITSGCMAADYVLKSDAHKFKQAWLKRYRRRFWWATRLHHLMLSPSMSKIAIQACHFSPKLSSTVWDLTRE